MPTLISPAEARAREQAQMRPIDVLRKAELERRVLCGEEEFAAWAKVATDSRIGLRKFRGLPEIKVSAVVRTLARFKVRIAPRCGEVARAAAEVDAAGFARRAFSVVQDVAEGRFKSSHRARAQLAGAKEALKIVGIGADRQERVTAAVQVNFGAALRGST